MAVTAKWYSNAISKAFNKEWIWSGTTVKVLLTTSTYAVGQTTHIYRSSVTNEVSGTGYTAGGATITSPTNTLSNLTTTLDGADVTWSTATLTARYAVIYDSTTTTTTTQNLIAYVDFGGDQSTSGGDFSIVWNASGIATVVVS